MKLVLLIGLLVPASLGCATTPNPYSYSGVMTMAECRAQCASYAYPVIGVIDGNCQCDNRHCLSSIGCEPLAPPPK